MGGWNKWAKLPFNTRVEVLEIKNRVGNELARTMESYETASVCLLHVSAQRPQLVQLLGGIVFATQPDREHGLVLHEQQRIRDRRGVGVGLECAEALGEQVLLDTKGTFVVQSAQVEYADEPIHPGK